MENWWQLESKSKGLTKAGDHDRQVAYHQTFYQTLRGRECLVDLRHYVALMTVETPEAACMKLACQHMLDYIKTSAGIHESVELIAAEGAMAGTGQATQQEPIDLLEPT